MALYATMSNLNTVLYLENFCTDKYLTQQQSQAKSSGIKPPEVHDVKKNLDSNQRPEKQHTVMYSSAMCIYSLRVV